MFDSNIRMKSSHGFTLTEVLLAVVIVGVIAALVLPAVISHYNDTAFSNMYKRETQAIESALNALPVAENKANFGETMMYSAIDPVSYEDNAGKFMKKYLRVSKYCGDTINNLDDIKKECFADKYYEYPAGEMDKKVITPEFKGACAVLKNGVSICMEPQIGSQGVRGIIDLNGLKGPNVSGRDYHEFAIDSIDFDSVAKVNRTLKEDVKTEPFAVLVPDEGNPCGENDSSNACCKYRSEHNLPPADSNDPCCLNATYGTGFAACTKEVKLTINYYPTSTCTSGCQPYINAVGTVSSKTFTVLPPTLYLYCDGVYVTTMSGSTLGNAINATSGSFNFDSANYTNNDCQFSGQTTGKTSSKSSVVFSNGTADITENNIKWHIDKH